MEGLSPPQEHQDPAQHVYVNSEVNFVLQKEITELWTQRMDDIPYLKALVDSMPRRLEDVISRDGNTTKY